MQLMDDQKKRRAIDAIARDCIVVRLRVLNRVVTKVYDDALRTLGLKVSQLNILLVPGKFGLARPAAVCELQLDPSTLSHNVERMRAGPSWEEAQHTAGDFLGQEGAARLTRTVTRLGMPPGNRNPATHLSG